MASISCFNRFKIAVHKFQFTLRREPGAGFTGSHGKIIGVLNTASITTRRSAVFAILSSIASRISFSYEVGLILYLFSHESLCKHRGLLWESKDADAFCHPCIIPPDLCQNQANNYIRIYCSELLNHFSYSLFVLTLATCIVKERYLLEIHVRLNVFWNIN